MSLHQWSPATQLAKLDRDFEDTLNHFMSHDWGLGKPSSRLHYPPAIESFIESNRLVVRAVLPGVDPNEVEIRVDGNVLTIRGSRTAASQEQYRDFVHREIRYGRFERAISIPNGLREQDISAAYNNGVLELTVPLDQAIEVRKVSVQMPNRAGEPERRQ